MARARGARTKVFVTLGVIKYGFSASANSAAYRTILGHTVFADQAGVVFGANSPKPRRASKEVTGGNTVSSFIDPAQETAAKADGWVITGAPRRRGLANTPRSRTVFVPMPGGYNYAWNLNTAELGLADELGFELAAGTTPNLVWGSTPKPPIASKKNANGQRVSTFIVPDQTQIDLAIDAGYSVSDQYSVVPDTP